MAFKEFFASIVRTALLRIQERVGDPGAEVNRVLFYGKDIAGVTQGFAQASDGTVTQLTPQATRFQLAENWTQNDVPANQAATALAANVSQLFDESQQIRAGSIVGVNLRFTNALTAGSATALVTINGVATAFTVTVNSPDTSARATQAAGVTAFAAGDTIGAQLSTTAGFLPADSNDVEVTIEVAQ